MIKIRITKKIKYFLAFSCLICCFLIPHSVTGVMAQTNQNDWSTPINLSNSGSTQSPELVVDSKGEYHVFWVDKFAGYMYRSSSDGKNWDPPVSVKLPFSEEDSSIQVTSDGIGEIFAFWINKNGGLNYSRVPEDFIKDANVWQVGRELAESALDYSISIDTNGTLHLAYVRGISSQLFPAGVYYRISSDNGITWSDAKLIYGSDYFRSTLSSQVHVSIATSLINETNVVNIAWDNYLIKRIFTAQSLDDGQTWSQPNELLSPATDSSQEFPFFVSLTASGKNVLLVWEWGQPNLSCSQFSQWSEDAGKSWSTPIPVFNNNPGCPIEIDTKINSDEMMIVTEAFQSNNILLAWNGKSWSNYYHIPVSFRDSYTSNTVSLENLLMQIDQNNQIWIVGNDSGLRGDTWLFSLSLDHINSWFPSNSSWDIVGTITSGNDYEDIQLIAGKDNRINMVWIQSDSTVLAKPKRKIMYSSFVNNSWSEPVEAVSIQAGDILSLSSAIDQDRIYLVWAENSTDQIFMSQSSLDHATIPSEWSTPQQLTETQIGGSLPKIVIKNDGFIYVSYCVPVNSNKGIYIMKSMDSGESWTSPVKMEDSESSDWDMIASLQMIGNNENGLNVIWKTAPIQGNLEQSSLFYSSSMDNGDHWTMPEEIAKGNISWSNIIQTNENVIHIMWQISNSMGVRKLWHQFSTDGGVTWNLPASYNGFADKAYNPTVTQDLNQLHLFMVQDESPTNFGVSYLTWKNGSWSNNEDMQIGSSKSSRIEMQATISSLGELMFVYIDNEPNTITQSDELSIKYLSKAIVKPEVQPTPEKTISPTQLPTPEATLTPVNEPLQTETSVVPTVEMQNTVSSSQNSWMGLVIGLGSVFLLLTIFIVVYFTKLRR